MTNREWLETLPNSQWLEYTYVRCVAMNGGECPDGLNCTACQLKWLNDEHKETENDKS